MRVVNGEKTLNRLFVKRGCLNMCCRGQSEHSLMRRLLVQYNLLIPGLSANCHELISYRIIISQNSRMYLWSSESQQRLRLSWTDSVISVEVCVNFFFFVTSDRLPDSKGFMVISSMQPVHLWLYLHMALRIRFNLLRQSNGLITLKKVASQGEWEKKGEVTHWIGY